MPETLSSNSLCEVKRQLRKRYAAIRRAGDEGAQRRADAAIAARLGDVLEYSAAPLILTYVSVRCEPDTLLLIARALAAGKKVACPRVEEGERAMSFRLIASLSELVPGAHGLMEPPENAHEPDSSMLADSVCLVPGLAFDVFGGRLGYGGGYYDSFLPGYTGKTIGLCRADALSPEQLPHGEFDRSVDMIVTPEAIIYPAAERPDRP